MEIRNWISVFEKTYSSPIVIAPMGHQTQFHKNGETETAKGAENQVSYHLELKAEFH